MRKFLSVKNWLFLTLIISLNGSFAQTNAQKSVLNEGDWFKVKVSNTGLCKVTFEYLNSIGFPISSCPSNEIKLYGNSTGLLPFKNNIPRPDDLLENALLMFDGGDGTFGPGDYFLYFAKGPDTWSYNMGQNAFRHTKHIYDDYSYYFLTRNTGAPARVAQGSFITDPSFTTIDAFKDFAFYEKENENLAKSGRTLYGEKFDFVDQYSFDFNFPEVIPSEPATIRTHVAARTTPNASTMAVKMNGSTLGTMSFSPITSPYVIALDIERTYPFTAQNNNKVNFVYTKGSQGATAWLDYIEVNVVRKLTMQGNSMAFRTTKFIGLDSVVNFQLSNVNESIIVMDVTNPTNPVRLSYDLVGSTLNFKARTDSLREYIAFYGSNFSSPAFVSKVQNQNLHSLSGIDLVILTHPDFLDQAQRLANFHRTDGLTVEVIEPGKVYNEFASGARDITAIKDFMKMLYFRDSPQSEHRIKYLLLFGDGSYMNKDYEGNTNFLPTYQSENSEDFIESFVSDDYFGFLDPNEGESPSDLVDIGIGRFPVSTKDQAKIVVDKILHYASTGYQPSDKSPYGDWRNKVLFLADDLSGNPGNNNEIGHVQEADFLAQKVEKNFKPYFTDKVYLDAYKQVSTPGGERYPEAANAFRNKVQQGALIVNYSGHGGEVGLAHERILDLSTISNWTNYNTLPLFVTATCEFSRFDDPARTSAGELILLSNKGGGIGLLSTTRLVFASPNFTLNNFFYDYALPDSTGVSMRLGDITRLTKVEAAKVSPQFHNHMNFMLLGDPALRLAYPKHKVLTTAINGVDINQPLDTIKAFGEVTIQGIVANASNQKLTSFNGIVEVTVLDKAEKLTTLGNDAPLYYQFELKDKLIYKGKASVVNGDFSITFIVPKDISFAYGNGTIMYYANTGSIDANGSYEQVVIGGSNPNGSADNQGPTISLFINETSFKPGGITNENPNLLAFVYDESGINTTGNGIGHELLAVIDEDTENAIVLNSYYSANLDTYKEGKVEYPFYKLSEGEHKLRIKVWDINNNSSSASTYFVVQNASSLKIENLINFPNPVTNQTTFSFDHNQSGEDLKVSIAIFDALGKKIKEIETLVNEGGYKSNSIRWDCTTDSGHTIDKGIYVYRLTVTKTDGTEVSKTNRLLVLK